ncbi:lipopolysaccharide biosynthesis protein [Pelotalea chapellei]|uniref:Lipopolysaccharide biosynthesis protein n=1 Tax=Pelotalea chapellei TaxID=44671 RepID=A0ABS5UA33_9BACT|nr:lipopolysaccharide biosynthesis protein [Pelotalea chapellei]MBT1072534.1 lipopolysaccharide biosynthesis protein [Pelotalea chapellei]
MVAGMLFERFLKFRHEMAWVLLGQFLGFTGSFIGIKVLTTLMGPKGYGQLALGLTIAGLFNMYIYGPLANVVARFYTVYRERNLLPVYCAVLRKGHLVLGGTLLLLAGITVLVLRTFESPWALIAGVAILYGVAGGVNASFIAAQNALRQRRIVALHQGADVWLRTGLSILLLHIAGKSGHMALLGYALGTLLITCSQAIFARKNPEIRQALEHMPHDPDAVRACRREFLRYAAPFVFFAGFAAVSMYADRWVIQYISGENALGIYAAIYAIASSPVNLLFALVNQLMVPIIFEKAGALSSPEQVRQSETLVSHTILFSGAAMAVMIILAWLLGKPLITLLTMEVFAEHHHVLWIVMLGLSLFNIGQVMALKGIYSNCPNIYMLPKGLQAASFLVMAYFLALSHGIEGVAAALCISSLIYIALVYYVNTTIRLEFGAGPTPSR